MRAVVAVAILSVMTAACEGRSGEAADVETTEADALSTPSSSATTEAAPAAPIDLAAHPLTAPWPGPDGGAPRFAEARVEDFEPVLTAAMDAALAEIEAIAANPEPATFENTIAALERAGAPLDRARAVYGVWSSSLNSEEFQQVSRVMAPRFAEFQSKIVQNAALFQRIAAVYEGAEYKTLRPEQQRVAWQRWNNFVRAGAKLAEPEKARLREINQRLATLYNEFENNVLADEEDYVTYLTADQLGGLSESLVASAAAAAETRGHPGEYAITNTRSSMEPFLTYSDERALREQVWRTYYSRGDNGDAHDNNAIIAEILKLRAERAKLLGYPTHAHWRLEVAMARTPESATALMESVWPAAIARVAQEVADMQALADAEGEGVTIEPWDYRYYQEKVREQRYAFDAEEVRNYLQLESLREGMFWAAGELFDFAFEPYPEAPVFHEDVRAWRVTRKSTGALVGLWYFDPYARAGKRSGAWMSTYRSQARVDGEVTPIVSNNANFVKPAPGDPVLISWDDATTLFHEFGHALHALSSNVTYPSVSGTAVARDYVEFPSQLFEHWLMTDEVLSRFARHVETGEPIPGELVAKLKAAAKFNQGFATTEYLAAALVDMRLHLAGDAPIDPDAFERETLAALGMPSEIVMRHRTPQFNHVFSSDGYSAGYYSYLWADTLTADAAEAFEEAPGGYFDKDVAARLQTHIFAVGDTIDAAEAFAAFRGRAVDTAALMRKRGFPVGEASEGAAAEPR
jgi:peptidyl-dipeptidase Dcp